MILENVSIASLEASAPYGLIRHGAIAVEDERIQWVGNTNDLSSQFASRERIDLEGRLVTPGLIDCHTHVVYGGERAREFELRLEGASYEEVARAGGGIVSTVKQTRQHSEAELLNAALARVDRMIAEGVTTLEVKSGYGLDQDTELKMLRVARRIAKKRAIDVKTSFLGAHAVPVEFGKDRDGYIDTVCIPTLEAAATQGLADAVDGFCETIAFTPAQIERVFDKARVLGLPVKLHAEQLSDLGGAKLAARYNALSADHLEYLDDAGAQAMANSGTVAVMLPGAFYTLRETRLPPISSFRSHGVRMAVASDCNPGSSPLTSILLTMNMACTLFRMTPEEALRGTTQNAAAALGLADRGTIAHGLRADLCVWDVEHPSELAYRIGYNPLHKRVFRGQFQ